MSRSSKKLFKLGGGWSSQGLQGLERERFGSCRHLCAGRRASCVLIQLVCFRFVLDKKLLNFWVCYEGEKISNVCKCFQITAPTINMYYKTALSLVNFAKPKIFQAYFCYCR